MRLRRTRLRTTQTMAMMTTIHRATMPQRMSVSRKSRTKEARLILAVVFSEFVPAGRVGQSETAPTTCMSRGCRVCKKKNLSGTYMPS